MRYFDSYPLLVLKKELHWVNRFIRNPRKGCRLMGTWEWRNSFDYITMLIPKAHFGTTTLTMCIMHFTLSYIKLLPVMEPFLVVPPCYGENDLLFSRVWSSESFVKMIVLSISQFHRSYHCQSNERELSTTWDVLSVLPPTRQQETSQVQVKSEK